MNRVKGFGVGLCVAIGFAACSGDGDSPTSPSTFLSGGATTIRGTAVAGGPGPQSGRSTLWVGALDSHTSSFRVCVVGTDICVDLDETGTFELRGNFVGDVQLHITGPGQDVRVTVHDVAAGETIIVSISLNGDSGTIHVEFRQGGVAAVRPAIEIEKETNGEDADFSPGPRIRVGDRVRWTYVVTNTGTVPLTSIEVVDDQFDRLPCDEPDVLEPMDSFECAVVGTAVLGQYTNIGSVTAFWGTDAEGGSVADSDESHYFGGDDREDVDGVRKVQLCHLTGNGSFRLIDVSSDAVPAHMAHGDERPLNGRCPASGSR